MSICVVSISIQCKRCLCFKSLFKTVVSVQCMQQAVFNCVQRFILSQAYTCKDRKTTSSTWTLTLVSWTRGFQFLLAAINSRPNKMLFCKLIAQQIAFLVSNLHSSADWRRRRENQIPCPGSQAILVIYKLPQWLKSFWALNIAQVSLSPSLLHSLSA